MERMIKSISKVSGVTPTSHQNHLTPGTAQRLHFMLMKITYAEPCFLIWEILMCFHAAFKLSQNSHIVRNDSLPRRCRKANEFLMRSNVNQMKVVSSFLFI